MSRGAISSSTRSRIRIQAKDRCGYCQSQQRYIYGWLEIEHIIPVGRGGSDDEDNLWLACGMCNGYKGAQTHARDPLTGRRVRLFDPRRQQWSRHFSWNDNDTLIIGRTMSGRATVLALQLNNLIAVAVRKEWVAVGWHPPKD